MNHLLQVPGCDLHPPEVLSPSSFDGSNEGNGVKKQMHAPQQQCAFIYQLALFLIIEYLRQCEQTVITCSQPNHHVILGSIVLH